MSKWINLPRTQGLSSKQAHTDLPEDDQGKQSYERELGQDGFLGPCTHMYHKHPPCHWSGISGELIHRAFDTQLISSGAKQAQDTSSTQPSNHDSNSNSPWQATKLLFNNDLQIHFWLCESSMKTLARNADGDEMLFIHQGEGDLFCDYGHMHFSQGDYIILPRGTLWRIECENSVAILLLEASQDHFRLPDRGLLGAHAIFDPAVLETPEINSCFKAQQTGDIANSLWSIEIKRLNKISQMQYPYNPLDAIGWHGNLMPVKLNWRDIRPVMSHRYHLPPSAHTTFLCHNFMVSTFVPRPIESDPGALKVPFYHSNDDYDEVIFYHAGNFFSRDNIESGMITLHPAGIPHGPHPKAYQTGKNHQRKQTDEVAIMIDARYPLQVTEQAMLIENKDYINAWKD